MHFLMGLNEEYNHSKDQILMMDPLPSVNKVYSLVLKIEKQRMVNMVHSNDTDITALLAKSHIIGHRNGRFETEISQFRGVQNSGNKSFAPRKGNHKGNYEVTRDKDRLHCEHCGMIGHTMSSCFKIHGYPDWYKGLKNHISQATMRANLASTTPETPHDYTDIAASHNDDASSHQTSTDIDLSTIIQREIAKYMKDKGSNDPIGLAHTNLAAI